MLRVVISLCIMACMASLVASDCNNPLFSQPIKSLHDQSMNLLPTPQQDTLGKCLNVKNKQSCCDSATFQPVIEAINEYDREYSQMVDEYNQVSDDEIISALQQSNAIPPQDIDYIRRGIDIIRGLFYPAMKCAAGVEGYMVGMFCFGCDPDYANYYDAVTNELTLLQSTCDSLYNDCSDLFSSMQGAITQLLNLFADAYSDNGLTNEANAIREMASALGQAPNVCYLMSGGMAQDCKQALCEEMIGGLDFNVSQFTKNIPKPPTNNGVYDQLLNSLSFSQSTLEATLLYIESLSAELFSPMASASNHILRLPMMRSLSKQFTLKKTILHRMTTRLVSTLRSLATSNSDGGKAGNKYSNSGYDAYGVGCKSGVSTTACTDPTPSSNSLAPWKIAVIVISCLVAVAAISFVAVYFYRRHKRNQVPAGTSANAYRQF